MLTNKYGIELYQITYIKDKYYQLSYANYAALGERPYSRRE